MLGNAHFYNRTIRKIVVAFGTLFNDITLYRYNKAGTTQYEHFKVPLSYGSKERYLTRITADPTLTRSIATLVPRISFELTNLSYDSSRKQTTLTRNFAQSSSGQLNAQYAPIPYDFNFSLSIYVRNTEDGTQIIEQILPFFTPDFTVTVDLVPDMEQKYDMPIILNSVNTTTDYEGAAQDGATRLILWDLEFTVKGYIFPAVKQPGGLIGATYANTAAPSGTSQGRVITNLHIQTENKVAQTLFVDYANGNNYFTTAESIRIDNTDKTGKVVYFSNSNTGILIVGDMNQLVEVGDVIRGDYSRARYTVTSLDSAPAKVISIFTTATPNTAGPDDEFGFAETFVDWPNTL